MAMIERSQFGLIAPLDDGENGRVNESERQITVAVEQFSDSLVILRLEVNDFDATLLRIGQKAQKGVWTKTLACKPVELNDNGRGDEHVLVGRLQETGTRLMVLICDIHRGIEGPGVANQRHDRG